METGDGDRAGLRERKKRHTRSALSWAALRLVVERGLADVRVEDIAAEAGVSTRTFNNYFSSKGEAIAAHHFDRSRRIAVGVRGRPAAEPLWEAIENAVLAEFPSDEPGEPDAGRTEPHPEWVAGVRLMLAEPALQGEMFRGSAAVHHELAAAIAARTGTNADRDMYPQLVAGVVDSAVRAAMGSWLQADPPVSFVPLLRDALGRVSAGLPPP